MHSSLKAREETRFSCKTVTKILFALLCCAALTAYWNAGRYDEVRLSHLLPKSKTDSEMKFTTQPSSVVMNMASAESTCAPRKHFVYIKTHKTGSATLKQIVVRFTKKHHLPVMKSLGIPFNGGYPGRVDQRFLLEPIDGKWQRAKESMKTEMISYNHIRFDARTLRTMMFEDAVFFTIIRQPWNQFQSTYNYYYGSPLKEAKLGINCFKFPFYQIAGGEMLSIFDYLLRAGTTLDSSIPWFFRSSNYQSHDLGLDPTLMDNNEIEKEITKLSKQIDLVMITEYFDESLILLKELLCMDWSDLWYNVIHLKKYTRKSLDENPKAEEIFHTVYKLDIALYKHFNDTFWRKVDAYGRERMAKDVTKLRQLQNKYLRDQASDKKRIRKNRSIKVQGRKTMKNVMPEDVLKNRTRAEMVDIITQKMSTQNGLIAPEETKELAEYMIDNYGGCPI